MKESKGRIKGDRTGTTIPSSKASSVSSLPLILDIDDFKGDFSFDALFGNLVNDLLPSFKEEDVDSSEGGQDILSNGHLRGSSKTTKSAKGASTPLFPEVDGLLSLFKDSCRELVDLRQQIDAKLDNLKKEVSIQDSKHRKTLSELLLQMEGLHKDLVRETTDGELAATTNMRVTKVKRNISRLVR